MATDTPMLDLSPERLSTMRQKILDLDEKIDAAGASSSPRYQLRDQLLTEYGAEADPIIESVKDLISDADDEQFIGTVLSIVKKLRDLEGQANAKLGQMAEARKDEIKQEEISPAELATLQEERQKEYDKLSALETLFGAMGLEFPVELPTKRRFGATGSRGPNIWSKFQYSFDGQDLEPANNKLSKIKDRFGFEKVSQLKELMGNQGITKDTVVLPKNKTWSVKGTSLTGEELVLSARPLPEYESEWNEAEQAAENADPQASQEAFEEALDKKGKK